VARVEQPPRPTAHGRGGGRERRVGVGYNGRIEQSQAFHSFVGLVGLVTDRPGNSSHPFEEWLHL